MLYAGRLMSAVEKLPEKPPRQFQARVAEIATPDSFASVTTPEERRRAFFILFVSLICMGAGQSVMYGILPFLARQLGLTEFQAQLPFAVSAAIWVYSSTFWGKKSDHWGRKPVILLGLTAFGLSFGLFGAFAQAGDTGLLAVAIAYPCMIAARALYGLFGSGASPAAQAYVADRTTRAERTKGVATLSAAFGLGQTVGPLAGTLLVAFGAFVPYYVTALAAFASAAAIWLLLPERTQPRIQLEHQQPKLSWRDRRILPFVIFGAILGTAGAIPIPVLGYVFIDVLHLRQVDAIQFTNIGILASSLATLFAQLVVVQRFNISARALMLWGSVIALASFVLFAGSRQFGPMVVALVISGFGFGMVRPGYAAASSLAVDPDEQGAVAGIMGATSAAGYIFGPLIATKLYRLSPMAAFWFGALLMAMLCAYALLSPPLRRAGALAPESDVVDESAQTQVPGA